MTNCNFFSNLKRNTSLEDFDKKSIEVAKQLAKSAGEVTLMERSSANREWRESEHYSKVSVREIFAQIISDYTDYHSSCTRDEVYYLMALGNDGEWCFAPDYLQACLESGLFTTESEKELFSTINKDIEAERLGDIENKASQIRGESYCLAE